MAGYKYIGRVCQKDPDQAYDYFSKVQSCETSAVLWLFNTITGMSVWLLPLLLKLRAVRLSKSIFRGDWLKKKFHSFDILSNASRATRGKQPLTQPRLRSHTSNLIIFKKWNWKMNWKQKIKKKNHFQGKRVTWDQWMVARLKHATDMPPCSSRLLLFSVFV